MIVEAIMSTHNGRGIVNCAPVGVHVENPDTINTTEIVEVFLYQGSKTRENLSNNNTGVINFTDDAEIFVDTALFNEYSPSLCSDKRGSAYLRGAKMIWGFSVISSDEHKNPARYVLEIQYSKMISPMIFSRAFAAIIEATIAATRIHLFSQKNLLDNFAQWQSIVVKTGGEKDKRSFHKIENYLKQHGYELPMIK